MFIVPKLNIQSADFPNLLSVITIRKIVQFCSQYFHFRQEHLLIINFVDIETMSQINYNYYPFKKISDVLTFSYQKRNQLIDPQLPWGEIYLCSSKIIQKTPNEPIKINQDVQNLLLHGLFHLLNYHHQTDKDWQLLDQLKQEFIHYGVING